MSEQKVIYFVSFQEYCSQTLKSMTKVLLSYLIYLLLVTAPTHYMLKGSAHFGLDCTVYACMVCSKTLVTGMNNKHAGQQSNVHITSMTYANTLRIHFCATLSHHQICVCFLYS